MGNYKSSVELTQLELKISSLLANYAELHGCVITAIELGKVWKTDEYLVSVFVKEKAHD